MTSHEILINVFGFTEEELRTPTYQPRKKTKLSLIECPYCTKPITLEMDLKRKEVKTIHSIMNVKQDN